MKERLNESIKAALLRGDSEQVASLRFIKNALDSAEKQKGSDLSDEDIVLVLRKELKKREEASELFAKGGNQASANKEIREAELIKSYLPAELSEQDIEEQLLELIGDNKVTLEPSSMGQVMSLAKQQLGPSANPSLVAKVASRLLSGKQ